MTKILPVIFCSGSGAHLWPLSRSDFPKQFLVLSDDALMVADEDPRFLALDRPKK